MTMDSIEWKAAMASDVPKTEEENDVRGDRH